MGERYVLVLEAGPDPNERAGGHYRDGEYRLRLALKTLGRAYGLRCLAPLPSASMPASASP